MQEENASASSATTSGKGRSKSYWIPVLIGLGVVCLGIGLLIWWNNRPIRPVVLTQPEIQVVEQKLTAFQPPAGTPPATVTAPSDMPGPELRVPPAAETEYQPGTREIILTDREINGLFHHNTDLGDQIAFGFTPGAMQARIETLLPDDVPFIGGKKLQAKARFTIDSSGPAPSLALEDITVWGISVPNDWLGGIKGKNLLGDMLGSAHGNPLPGIESLSIEHGRLVIRLKE